MADAVDKPAPEPSTPGMRTPPEVRIRRIHRRDLNRTWEFLKLCFRDVNRDTVEYQRPRSKNRFLEIYEEEGIEQLIFETRLGEKDVIIGYAECAFEVIGGDNWINARYFSKRDMRPLFVEELAVHPEMHGQGIGGFILEQLDHLARVRGCTHLVLEVAENNDNALKFYRTRSFYKLDAAIFLAKKVVGESELLPPRKLKRVPPREAIAVLKGEAPSRPTRRAKKWNQVRPPHISRWDLDKTYLRTEFATFGDLVRTALERADEKRTNPGAATLLRELSIANISIHILSGSPEQMRRRLEEKLKLDGIKWDDFTLKPNLKNMLRLRFRALRDQLGYKLPALMTARTESEADLAGVKETLFGDDAEADAFVYSLYADIMAGNAGEELVREICERGRVYDDVTESTLRSVHLVKPEPVVERILIHLEQQTQPRDFQVFGARVVPFYNYLQAAYVVHEDGRLPAESLLRVAGEMVVQHRFDGDALARSYADVARRGHLAGTKIDAIEAALPTFTGQGEAKEEVRRMVEKLPAHAAIARDNWKPLEEQPMPDYLALVGRHNPRSKKKKR